MMNTLGIPHSYFDGIDGKKMSKSEVAELRPQRYDLQFGRSLSPGEIGCAASFRALFREIAKGDDTYVAVLEDDAILSAESLHFLNRGTLSRLPRFDVLRLYSDIRCPRYEFSVKLGEEGDRELLAPVKAEVGCVAQIVTREGARKIAESMLPLHCPIDNLIYRDARIPALRIIQLKPGVAIHRGVATTIGDVVQPKKSLVGRLRRKHGMLLRNVRSLVRFVSAWGPMQTLSLRLRK